MKINKNLVIIILATLLVLILLFAFVKPKYDEKITEQAIFSIASQQASSGQILILNNNALTAIDVRTLCGNIINGSQ